MAKPGPRCPYCPGNPPSILADAGRVYGEKYEGQFSMWVCSNRPDCDAYVGIVSGSPIAEPSGTLANAELRALRKRLRAHYGSVRMRARDRQEKIRAVNHMNEDQCRRALMALERPAEKDQYL